jgi:hypothetical protein
VRLIAFSRRGFARGQDVTFTTPAAAPTTAPPLPPGQPPAPLQSPAPSPTGPAAPPTPVLGTSVTVTVRHGTVTVKLPGTGRYVALADVASLPLGAILDTREGSVTLRSALPDGRTQTGIFHGGLFEVRQPGTAGLVELVLRGAPPSCARAAARTAGVSTKRRRRPPRRLWGNAKGKFRTRGGNSVATVRGTAWYVEDRCEGTQTLKGANSGVPCHAASR